VRRLQARLVTSSQEARSPSGPDEGPAFGGWTWSDEGQRKCRLDHASGEKPSGPIKKYGGCVKNRRGGAPGGVRAGTTARGRLREVPSCYQRHFGAPLPHANEGRNEGAGPAPTNEGDDESRLYGCLKLMRVSAGCLTPGSGMEAPTIMTRSNNRAFPTSPGPSSRRWSRAPGSQAAIMGRLALCYVLSRSWAKRNRRHRGS
jgi:hypothetical protein